MDAAQIELLRSLALNALEHRALRNSAIGHMRLRSRHDIVLDAERALACKVRVCERMADLICQGMIDFHFLG
jgi:hypothetical protein